MAKITSSVRMHHGTPRLFINGQLNNGAIASTKGFLFRRPQNAYDTARRLHEEGVEIYRDVVMMEPREDGSCDSSVFDTDMEGLARVVPDMMFMARLPNPEPPAWWVQQHPDDLMVHRDPFSGDRVDAPHHVRPSFSSRAWRRDVQDWVRQMVTHCEQRYGDRVMGYFLHGGIFEWAYSWNEVLSDYSPAQVAGYRRWLRKRYDNDLAQLRAAWGEEQVDFDAVRIPRDRARVQPNAPLVLDPALDRRIIDYLTFHSEVVADCLIELAGCVKNTLRQVGSQKVVGTWYGFEFWPAGHAGHYHNSGQHDVKRVLECDDVDFYSLIHSHFERKPGGLWVHHLAGSSITAHGRLLYEEDDTATHAAQQPLGWQQFCRTARESDGVLSRNVMGGLTCGAGTYWHDFSAEGWFADDDVACHIGRLLGLVDEELTRPFRSRCQVAGFVSKRSKRYFRQNVDLTDALYCRQVSELLHCGAPVDMYYAEDLPLLERQGVLERYAAAVFFDCLDLDVSEHKAIRKGLAGRGRTLLWCFAAGLVSGDEFSTESMKSITGMDVEVSHEPQTIKAATFATGSLVQYGPDAVIRPVIRGVATPDVQVLGYYVQPEAPALMVRDFDDWRSIWTGAPALPSTVLRTFLQQAGVHLYTENGDQALAVNDLLAVHAGFAGPRTVFLPEPCIVEDALTGAPVSGPCRQFTWEAERADTGIWRLTAAEE